MNELKTHTLGNILTVVSAGQEHHQEPSALFLPGPSCDLHFSPDLPIAPHYVVSGSQAVMPALNVTYEVKNTETQMKALKSFAVDYWGRRCPAIALSSAWRGKVS